MGDIARAERAALDGNQASAIKIRCRLPGRFFDRLDRKWLFRFALFYAVENSSPWYSLAFSGAGALGSIYGFLQGAWPFGLIEAIWTIVAVNRWRVRMRGA